MVEKSFNLLITIDGSDAQAEASRLSKSLSKILAEGFAVGKKGISSPAQQKKVLNQLLAGERHLTSAMQDRERTQRRISLLTNAGKQLAKATGQEWADITQQMRTSGETLESVVSGLRRASAEQRQLQSSAARTQETYRKTKIDVSRVTGALSKARTETAGITMLAGDIQRLGRGLQFAGTALAGSLTIAGRNYVEFAKQTDAASRSMLLNQEITTQLRREIMLMSADMGMLDPQEMAEGLTIWAQATGQQIESSAALNRVLEQTVSMQQLAELSTTHLEQVTDGTASAIRQFGLTLADTDRVVAVYNKTANDTLASVGDMTEAFKFVGPQAKSMGEDLESAAAVIGLLADQNIRGSMAGRAYRQMLLSLAAPTRKAAGMLRETFGEDNPFFDEGQFIGMAETIDLLASATERMTDEERSLLLSTLFTANAIPAVTALLDVQTAARERGINAIRAQTDLIEGNITAEVRAYGTMKQEIEGVNISMLGAVELWNTQLSQWNESDVRRVQQAEMRWKAFWLSVGEQVISTVLPALETASELLSDITRFVQETPAFVKVAMGLAGGALTLGTAVTAVGSLLRVMGALKTITIAMETLAATQATAATAQAAAAAAQTTTAVVTGGAALGGGVAIGAGKAAVGGGLAIGGGAVMSAAAIATTALAALPIGVLAFEALARTKFGEAVGLMEGTTGKIAGLAAYAAGDLFGKGEEWFTSVSKFTGVLDEVPPAARAASEALRVERKTFAAIAERSSQDYSDMGARVARTLTDNADAMSDYSDVGVRAARATSSLSVSIAELSDRSQHADWALAGEKGDKAIALYTQYLNDIADATESHASRLQELARDLDAELDSLDTAHAGRIAELVSRHQETTAKSWETYFAAQTKRAQDHVKNLRRLDEDHEDRLSAAITRRDATAALGEIRNYEKQRRRAIEDYSEQQSAAAEQYQRETAERQRSYETQIEQLRLAHERERVERITAYNERRVEEEREHRASLDAMRRDAFTKINEETNYYKTSQAVQRMWRAQMLMDTWSFMRDSRSLWQDYLATLPQPQYRPSYPDYEYQSGGYVSRTAPALVHAGEFMLTAATVKSLEREGGRLDQASFTGARGVNINMPIHASFAGGISASDRAWVMGGLQDMRKAIIVDVTHALEAA